MASGLEGTVPEAEYMMVKPQLAAFLRTVLLGIGHNPWGDPESYDYGSVIRDAHRGQEASKQGSSHICPVGVSVLKSETSLGVKDSRSWAAVWTAAWTSVRTHSKRDAGCCPAGQRVSCPTASGELMPGVACCRPAGLNA